MANGKQNRAVMLDYMLEGGSLDGHRVIIEMSILMEAAPPSAIRALASRWKREIRYLNATRSKSR